MRDLKEVARDLANAHREADPATTTIKFFPSARQNEVCLVEVSSDAPTTEEVMPFRFAASNGNGVEYPSVVILLSPVEWEKVKVGDLSLPEGWDLSRAEDI